MNEKSCICKAFYSSRYFDSKKLKSILLSIFSELQTMNIYAFCLLIICSSFHVWTFFTISTIILYPLYLLTVKRISSTNISKYCPYARPCHFHLIPLLIRGIFPSCFFADCIGIHRCHEDIDISAVMELSMTLFVFTAGINFAQSAKISVHPP